MSLNTWEHCGQKHILGAISVGRWAIVEDPDADAPDGWFLGIGSADDGRVTVNQSMLCAAEWEAYAAAETWVRRGELIGGCGRARRDLIAERSTENTRQDVLRRRRNEAMLLANQARTLVQQAIDALRGAGDSCSPDAQDLDDTVLTPLTIWVGEMANGG